MTKNPTISDVAEHAGFSTATVSAVINDKGTMNSDTRAAVLRAIQELQYRPRETARHRLRSHGAKSLGLVIKEDDNPYYGEIIDGVRSVAEARGYLLLVSGYKGSLETGHQIVNFMITKDIDGLLITPAIEDDVDLSYIYELKRRNIPFVLLEQVRGIQTNMVDIDDAAASDAAVTHLIEEGHSNIIHFAGPRHSARSKDRIEGVRRAFSRSRLAFMDEHVVHVGAHSRDGYEKGMAYFREHRNDAPTAVTCYNDLVAIGLLRALHELSIQVPDEVSVIGFDDLDLIEYLPWPLSSVCVPKRTIGTRAAEILIEQLESDDVLPLKKVDLDCDLVIRETTAPPRN